MIRAAVVFMSAERLTITGLLPPSSRVRGVRFEAAARITCSAMPVAPVNTRWSNGSPANSWPASDPPMTTATSSAENTLANISAIRAEVAGVNSDGLIMARLPAARTPASGVKVKFTGKFHGLMIPITPLGWNRTSALAPNRPRIAGVVLRFSGFIQALRLAFAALSPPIEPATSVKALASADRDPKSALSAASMPAR